MSTSTSKTDGPSVAITSLSIRDFRGIESLDLDLRGPDGRPNSLVVLAGPNGCGKTAVLEAALFLVGGHDLLVGQKERLAIRRGASRYAIQATIQHGADAFTTRHESGRPVPKLAKVIPHWYFASWRAPDLPGPIDVTVGKRGRRPAKNDENRLLNIKQQLVNAATVERFQPTLLPVGRYSELIQGINEGWSDFYPDSGHTFAVEVITKTDEDESGSFDVYLCLPDGMRLEVDSLSAGQIELFLFLGELALNKDREGIIFIDEPELHLDPQWHSLLLRRLLRLQPRAQLIVATHSPEIYDAAASYERHFLVSADDPRSRAWSNHPSVVAGV
jgi:ABC-type transport system involved in cytochrome c biogenesis ATPase subunit